MDREGNAMQFETKGITAGTYQHEVDHLDMKLFLDRVDDPTTFCTWNEFQRYHEELFRNQVAEIVQKWGKLMLSYEDALDQLLQQRRRSAPRLSHFKTLFIEPSRLRSLLE